MVSISAPSSLASFASSRASSSKAPHVILSPVEGSNGKLGVATVQGDGVWTYDLVSLRPVSTYTVPPSTRFAGPAISYIIQPPSPLNNGAGKGKGKEKQVEADAVAEVTDAMDIDGEDEADLSSSVGSEEDSAQPSGPIRRTMVPVMSNDQGEVWMWDGEDGGEKVVIQLDATARFLHRIPDSPYPVLAIHTSSRLSLIGPRNSVHSIVAPSSSSSAPIVTSRVLPFDATSSGLITISETGQVTSLRIEHPEDGAPSLRVTSESAIPLGSAIPTKADKADTPKKGRGKGSHASAVRVSSADIGPDGLVALITSSGALITYDNRTSSIVQSSIPLAPPATSSAIALIPSSTSGKAICLHPTAKSPSAPASLIATLSSASPAVLGAADITNILPTEHSSVQHLSILAESSKGRSVVGVVAWHPTQSSGTPSQVGHGKDKDKDAGAEMGGRSIVHLVEVDAPARSVGMNALLGSAAITAKYLAGTATTERGTAATAVNGDASSRAAPSSSSTGLESLLAPSTRSADQWIQIVSFLGSPKGATVPSSQLALVLKLAIAEGRVDQVYKAILDLPPPDLAFRLELRRQLSAEEGNVLLGLLLQWTDAIAEQDEGVKWDDEVASTPSKPNMSQILTHTSTLLDSLLPLLITYEPSHSLLSSLSTSLGPMLDQQRTLTQLRAPIDALLTLAKREERKRALIREKRAAMRGGGDNANDGAEGEGGAAGKGRMRQGERTRMNRGTGQVGRLALGGDVGLWSVEDFDF